MPAKWDIFKSIDFGFLSELRYDRWCSSALRAANTSPSAGSKCPVFALSKGVSVVILIRVQNSHTYPPYGFQGCGK